MRVKTSRWTFEEAVLFSSVFFIHTGAVLSTLNFPGIWLISLMPFWIVILKNNFLYPMLQVRGHQRSSKVRGLGLLEFFLIVLFFIQVLRSLLAEVVPHGTVLRTAITMGTVIAFVASVYSYRLKAGSVLRSDNAFFHGVAAYIMVNFFLYLSNFGDTIPGSALMLGLLGVQHERVQFPIAAGLNNYAILCGAGFVYSIAFLKQHDFIFSRLYFLIVAIVAMISILLVDSRGALFFAFITAFSIIAFSATVWKRVYLVVVVVPLIPVLMYYALSSILSTGSPVATDLFVRSTYLADPGSGREIVWFAALDHLIDFNFSHLFGYGLYGQATSGIANFYDELFPLSDSPALITLHNFSLQMIFDVGYVGLGITLLYIFLLMKGLSKKVESKQQFEYFWRLTILVYLLLMGSTEAVPSLYFADVFLIFVIAVIGISKSAELTRTPKAEGA